MSTSARRLEFRILGPLEVVEDGKTLALGGRKPRALVALLLLRSGEVVSTDHLIQDLWGESPPDSAHTMVQVYVSRLRKVLEPGRAKGGNAGVLVSKAPGYALQVEDGRLDLRAFERLVDEGRVELAAGHSAEAAMLFEQALGLWRGPALAEFAYEPWAASEVARLEEVRLACMEDRVEAELACARHAGLIAGLEALVDANPLRERLRGQLMIALYRSGRQAEALEVYQATRNALVEGLGLEPGPEIQALHSQILNQDPALAAPDRQEATPRSARLPTAPTTFIGREHELEDVVELLTDSASRLVTLTGPGGTGKTRLALEAATRAMDCFRDGVCWVALAPLRDPALVTETISQAIGAQDGLGEHIGERELLLVLDNLEQVIEAAPELSSMLLTCPNLILLVTSRELLRVQGEVEYAVLPLDQSEAVSLFCDRAQLEPSIEVAELCARLDSLPLAVELAAARTRALSPAQILARLPQRLDLLKGGRDADPRQRTLRAAIEWSYDLLSPDEQQIFGRLSVFIGGCTLEIAETVCGADVDALQSLIEKSLLRHSGERYWMLETIREYAGDRLEASGEADVTRNRQAEFALALAERVRTGLGGPDVQRWMSELDQELENVRAVLAWLERSGQLDTELDLVGRVWNYWLWRGTWHEGRRWTEAVLDRRGGRPELRAEALQGATEFCRLLGDLETATAHSEERLAILRELGDHVAVAGALRAAGRLAADQHAYADAERMYAEAERGYQQAATFGGDDVRARANIAADRADLAMRQGDYARAVPLASESLALFRELGLDFGISLQLYNMAFCLAHIDLDGDALSALRESLDFSHGINDVEVRIWVLSLLAWVAMMTAQPELAATVLGAADGMRESVGMVLTGAEADLVDATRLDLGKLIGDEPFQASIAAGRRLSLDEAIEHALAVVRSA